MEKAESIGFGPHCGLAKREKRYRKLISVIVKTESGTQFSAVVTNLSKRGLGGKTSGFLEKSDRVTIVKEEFGQVDAQVRWVNGERFGLAFSNPISIDQFNFLNKNDKGHFVREIENGHVWKGFDLDSSTRRPGVTNQFSKDITNKH
jgi:PilZ domain